MRETFSGVFKEPFDQSIEVLKKAESENLQDEVVEIFKKFINPISGRVEHLFN